MARPRKTAPLRTRIFKVCLTEDEWFDISEQAANAGLTPSEYARRRIQGQRIVSRVHDHVVNELRRLGGLQKHLSNNLPHYRLDFERNLEEIRDAILRIDNTVAGSEEI